MVGPPLLSDGYLGHSRKQIGPPSKPGGLSFSIILPLQVTSHVLVQLVRRYKVCDLASLDRCRLLERCKHHDDESDRSAVREASTSTALVFGRG